MMNQCRVLIVIAQLFFVFIKPGQSDQLAVRSSLIDAPDVLQVNKRVKRRGSTAPSNSLAGEPSGMKCDGHLDRVGCPVDCFKSLAYIYNNRPTSGCAVTGSCAMMPLTGNFTNLIAPGKKPPYSYEQVSASYNGMFGYYCQGYISPGKFASDFPHDAFNSGYLLGTAGECSESGECEASECSADIIETIVAESQAYEGP